MKTFPMDSIDMVMFSNPYWWTRDFGQESVSVYGGKSDCQHVFVANNDRRKGGNNCVKCGAWLGELGLETDIHQHINNITLICGLLKRVLKRSGSLFLNIGDTYGTHSGIQTPRSNLGRNSETSEKIGLNMKKLFSKPSDNFVLEKNLFLIPSRIAISLQNDGWILRNDIIWQKTSVLHTGAKDRLTNTYEHIFWFVKSAKYYCDLESVKVPCKSLPDINHRKNLGDVWLINAKPPVLGDNVGSYPEEICVAPIKMCCPPDGIVLDPMCGIGTTCTVAKRLQRRFIGIDIVPLNVQKAKERLLRICPKCGADAYVAKHIGKIVCMKCNYENTLPQNP